MSLQENTIAYQLTIHRWGIRRQIPPVVLSSLMPGERDLVEKKMVSASKKIIESKEYDKIVSRDGYATRWLQEHSVPSLLKKGIYCIPTLLIGDVDSYMEGYKSERQYELVPQFLAVYEEQAQIARETLGASLFDALEYPSVSKMESLFRVETSYVSFDVPESLKYVNAEYFRREQEKVREQWEVAERAINQLLVEECMELVTGLQAALTGLADGTIKRFREANLANLQEWSALFLKARNVTENQELEAVVQQIQSVLSGVTQQGVKYNTGNVQQHLREAMSGINVELKGMLEVQGEYDRAITLE